MQSEKLRSLLSEGKTGEVLKHLLDEQFRFGDKTKNQIVALSSQFNRAQEERRSQIITDEVFNVRVNLIEQALLQIIDHNLKGEQPVKANYSKNILQNRDFRFALPILPFIFFWAIIGLYPSKKGIVHFDPKINNNIIELKFHRFNESAEPDTFKLKFVIKDTSKYKINPFKKRFFPTYLKDKSTDVSIFNNDRHEKFMYVNIRFDLSGTQDFEIDIEIDQITTKEISLNDFYFELVPIATNHSKPSASISKGDYLNLYPLALPGVLTIIWMVFLLFYYKKLKKT